jgi:hypothetical protein
VNAVRGIAGSIAAPRAGTFVADALSSDPTALRRVLSLDYRGRSEYDRDPADYTVSVELADLLVSRGVGPAVFIGPHAQRDPCDVALWRTPNRHCWRGPQRHLSGDTDQGFDAHQWQMPQPRT